MADFWAIWHEMVCLAFGQQRPGIFVGPERSSGFCPLLPVGRPQIMTREIDLEFQ